MKADKILVVGPIPPPFGGIATYVNSLLQSELIGSKHKLVSFNTSTPEKIRPTRLVRHRSYKAWKDVGIITFLSTFVYVVLSFFRFVVVLINQRIKIVHIHSGSYWEFWKNSFFLVLAKIFRRRVIFHIHGAIDKFYPRESSLLGKWLIRKALNLSDKIIVLSDGLKNFVSSLTNTLIISVYNGVNIEPFQNISRQMNTREKMLVVLSLAPLCKNKGTDDTILAISGVVKQNNNVRFLFAGRGPIKKYRSYVRELGIEKHCSFLGVITNDVKIELFRKASFFLLPSYAEGQPIAILEAMAAGLPVISTTVGSIPEVIANGENGFLIEPGDYNALAENVKLLLRDDELRNTIGQRNYEVAREKYDMNRVFSDITGIYDDLYSC